MPPALRCPRHGFILPRVPIVDIHMVKTSLGEFPAPLTPMHPFSLYAPPHFPRNQPVLATYSGQYMHFLSLLLLPPPAAHPLIGPHNLVTSHLRLFGVWGVLNLRSFKDTHTDCFSVDLKFKVTHTDCFYVDLKFKVTHTDCSKVCDLLFE